jgi:hypothetical protein
LTPPLSMAHFGDFDTPYGTIYYGTIGTSTSPSSSSFLLKGCLILLPS